jgi:hypothetical protein
MILSDAPTCEMLECSSLASSNSYYSRTAQQRNSYRLLGGGPLNYFITVALSLLSTDPDFSSLTSINDTKFLRVLLAFSERCEKGRVAQPKLGPGVS